MTVCDSCFISLLACWVIISTDNILKCLFFVFPRKQALAFHANCLLTRQFAHGMSKPIFWEKKENIIDLLSAEFAKRVVRVNKEYSIAIK